MIRIRSGAEYNPPKLIDPDLAGHSEWQGRARQLKKRPPARKEASVENFPAEMDSAVNKAVDRGTPQLRADARNSEELLKREFAAERKNLSTDQGGAARVICVQL
jgi:hypothetical protein